MTTTAKLTLEQFLAMPETEPASEFAHGDARPKYGGETSHSLLQTAIGLALSRYNDAHQRGQPTFSLTCVFGSPGQERVYMPDVTFILREHWPTTNEGLRDYHRRAPALAVEVLSPDEPASYLADKVQFYLLHGTRLVWLVDPDSEAITVFAPGYDARLLRRDDRLDGGDLLPDFSIPVADIFGVMRI